MNESIKLAAIIGLTVVLCISALLLSKYASDHRVIAPVKLSLFKSGDCYMPTGIHQPWEPSPAGIVVMVGYAEYLVLPAFEANRVSGGNKIGVTEDGAEFDSTHYKVDCPLAWKQHTTAKKVRVQQF